MTAAVSPTKKKPGFFALDLLDNRYPALHGLRVLGIVSVVQYHVTARLARDRALAFDRDWVASSFTVFFGMDLFFILSGFLIGNILLHAITPRNDGSPPRKGTIRRFYLRRAFRTFPPYYIVLTLLALTTVLNPIQRAHLPYEYAYLTNLVPLDEHETIMNWGWSLALEEQFYLVVPLLFLLLRRFRSDRVRVIALLLLWSSALVVRIVIFNHRPGWSYWELWSALYFPTYTRFDTLIAGVLLALVNDRWGEAIGRWLVAPFHRALLAMGSLTCLWILLRPGMFGYEYESHVRVAAWGTITSVMYFGFLLLLLHGDGWLTRALSAPIFRRIATLGYGVYLVHIPLCDEIIVPLAHRVAPHDISRALIWTAGLVLLLVLSAIVAYVMHVLIEKPALLVRDRVAR